MTLRPSHSGFEPRTRDPERRDFFDLRRRLATIDATVWNFKGTIAHVGPPTTGDDPLPNSNGDMWVDSAGNGWVWNGTTWVNVGAMRGPAGATGPPGAQGVPGPVGPEGDPGQDASTHLTGIWTYNATESAPPAQGQIRSAGGPLVPGGSVLIWLNNIDADGYIWPDNFLAHPGDALWIRDNQANWLNVTIDFVTQSSTPTRFVEFDCTVVAHVGSVQKNRDVQVTIAVLEQDGGGGGGTGTDEVWIGPDDPIAAHPTIELWYDPDAGGSGGGTGGLVAFTYTQATPASVWTIDHPLGFYPNVTVIDSGGTIVEGDLTYVSPSQIQLIFSAAFAGVAHLS